MGGVRSGRCHVRQIGAFGPRRSPVPTLGVRDNRDDPGTNHSCGVRVDMKKLLFIGRGGYNPR